MCDLNEDMLFDMFERQKKFMEMLVANDKCPEFPIDITSKSGQRLIKEAE